MSKCSNPLTTCPVFIKIVENFFIKLFIFIPKTTCFPSNHDVFLKQIKNYEPLVPGP